MTDGIAQDLNSGDKFRGQNHKITAVTWNRSCKFLLEIVSPFLFKSTHEKNMNSRKFSSCKVHHKHLKNILRKICVLFLYSLQNRQPSLLELLEKLLERVFRKEDIL